MKGAAIPVLFGGKEPASEVSGFPSRRLPTP